MNIKPILSTALSFGAAVALQAQEPGPGVLARTGDTEIKIEDIRASLETLDPKEQAALARNPNLLSQAVRSLLARQVVLKEALEKKWDQSPAAAAALQRARDNALVESYLQAVSLPPESFPSDAELKAFYEANKAQLVVPRQVRLSQIFIAKPKEAAALDKARAKLASVKDELAAPGADFAAIAKVSSDERASAERGGEAGWVLETQLRPEIRAAVSGLAQETVSAPIELDDGWHLVKIHEEKEAQTLGFDQVRGQLAQQLRAEKAKVNRQTYLTRLLEQNPLVINELALPQLLAKPAN
ncbi:MAG: peptidyl-prolyl cis-trans isomerase [Opitutaceae bacterium]|jgi:parvulin-like peptidyl-prolyl isomerase|nr:peptidyl-prolyl cis-trans isomerase [Opitutaceae bacterium]